MKSHHDNIWRYLHGELSEAKKVEFEQALQADEQLFQTLEERKKTDTELHKAGTEDQTEELIDVLLKKWEAEHPEYQEQPGFSRGKILKLSVPMVAAAAAAAYVLISTPWRSDHIYWQKSRYGSAPQFRDGTLPTALYSQSDLKRIDKLIRSEIEKELSIRAMHGIKWRLQLYLQEGVGGRLMVEIYGHAEKYPAVSKVWKTDFQSVEELNTETASWAMKIATDLTETRNP